MNNINTAIRIGIVEDHHVVREGIKSLIESNSHFNMVMEASNGKEFITLVKEHEDLEIILLDIDMPEMSGDEVCKFVKKHYPNLKVLVLSRIDEMHMVQYMLQLGANGYVLKSTSWDNLSQAITDVYEKGYHQSELVQQALWENIRHQGKLKFHLLHMERISKREMEVLLLICKAKTTAEIADELFISKRTVDGHRANLLKHMNVKNTTGLIVKALKEGLISLSDL